MALKASIRPFKCFDTAVTLERPKTTAVARISDLKIGPTEIVDSFAEAFPMRYTRLVITAHNEHWLKATVQAFCGYASSVISCDAEVGLERWLAPDETPDGRLGAAVMAFGFSTEALGKAVSNRCGQCVMTCPSTALFDGLSESDERVPLGKHVRFFGDGFQKSKVINGQRYWRVPVMDGEFLVEETAGVMKGVAGGNIIIQGDNLDATLDAAANGVDAANAIPGVIMPFPGGVARSGSKVGSKYKKLVASTADAYCPMLRGRTESKLHPDAQFALEIVIDGQTEDGVGLAMSAAARAAVGKGIVAITAGNYGGKLGKYHLKLRDLLSR